MKEPAMITCPHCGKQTAAEDVCRHCGRDIGTLQGLEVQYRDFKGSEMLDIKMSPPPRHKDERPDQKKTEAPDRAAESTDKPAAKQTALLLLAIVLIMIAAFGWYYVLKYFLKF